MIKVIVKFAEISLKGKNKSEFINKLKGNIQKSANQQNLEIDSILKEHARIIINYSDKSKKEEIIDSLKSVMGIKYFAFMTECEKSVEGILKIAENMIKNFKNNGVKSMSFKTKRSDKQFELNSPELNAKMGTIAIDNGINIDYKNKQDIIYTEIYEKEAYLYSEKISGQGGLPVASSGRVLCLLSGGIDSPVATYKMLKRGVTVDFLHFHTFQKNESVLETKMKSIIQKLNNYQFKASIYCVPYSFYEFTTIGKIPERFELVFFKHYIFKFAEYLAKKYDYSAVVCGDNLNQVASQTLENIKSVSYGINLPIYRPLLTYDKDEIIEIAKTIDTFDLSIEEYKDCCSMSSKNPLTQTKLEKFIEVLENSEIKELIENSFEQMERFLIKGIKD